MAYAGVGATRRGGGDEVELGEALQTEEGRAHDVKTDAESLTLVSAISVTRNYACTLDTDDAISCAVNAINTNFFQLAIEKNLYSVSYCQWIFHWHAFSAVPLEKDVA